MGRIDEIRAKHEAVMRVPNRLIRTDVEFIRLLLGDIALLLSEYDRLTALAQNGQSAIGTNKRLANEISRLTAKVEQLESSIVKHDKQCQLGICTDISMFLRDPRMSILDASGLEGDHEN